MSGPICKTMLFAALMTAAVPAAANAQQADLSAQARVVAKVDANTAKAVQSARTGAQDDALRHLRRARTGMHRAYGITKRIDTQAAATRFNESVDENNGRLETLVAESRGRVETAGAKAMADNIGLRSRTLLESMSAEDQDEFDGGAIVAHAEAFAEVSTFADGEEVGNRARRKLQQGLASVLELQTELAERYSQLYRESSTEGRQRLESIGAQIADETGSMRASVEDCDHSAAQVESSRGETTLGQLAASVEADVRADVGDEGSVHAQGEARGQGTISLPALP